ncbi:MAG: class I SAM-dependent methyltransferase [Rhodobacteraceae bacterium]|nr:class I SAM-dependent methyltransferase [Paracoccaceae bacterium]
MKLKTLELEATALMSEVMFGHGFAHYGYFPDGVPEILSAEALGRAQHAYFEKLVEVIPDGVRSILDVGSGTGANARALIVRGFDVTCVSPSARMNAMARAKLPQGAAVHDARFEEFQSDARFDLCLFAESFHYIDLEAALRQGDRYARRGMILFDYFRRPGHAHGDGTRGTHQTFLDAVAAQGVFRILCDQDMTAAITPTFVIHESIKNDKIAPFVTRFRADVAREYPWRGWLMEKMLGRVLDKLNRRTSRAGTFAHAHEYRLIVMERAQGHGAFHPRFPG